MRVIKLPNDCDDNYCKAMELVKEVMSCPYCHSDIIRNSSIVYAYPEDMMSTMHGPFKKIRARARCHYNSVLKAPCRECGAVIRSSPISDMYKPVLEVVRDRAIKNMEIVARNDAIVNIMMKNK